jgi:hypothetical protein
MIFVTGLAGLFGLFGLIDLIGSWIGMIQNQT